MLNYTWSKEYSVGDLVLDDHHKTLLGLFSKISEILYKPDKAEEVMSILRELKSYTKFHFGEEERRMIASNYPEYSQHKLLHDDFIKKVEELELEAEKNVTETAEDIFLFLNQWLINHIQDVDKRYNGKI